MKSITQLQLFAMFTQFLFSTAIGFFLGPIISKAGYMSWVSILLGCMIGLLLAYLSYRLALRRPNEFLGEYGSDIVGKWPHYVLFVLAIMIHLYMSAFILRQLTDFIVEIYLPGTPNWAVASLFGICVARSVRSGPVNFFRSAQGMFLFSIIAVFTFPLFVANEVDMDKLIALVTDVRPHGMWQAALISAALFGEMVFIIYLFPFFTNKEKTYSTLVWSGLTAVLITIANLIATLLLFGTELAPVLTYPTLELIRYIRAGSFLENLDPMLIVFWLFSMLLKIGLFLLLTTTMTANLFKLKDHKPFSYGMAAAMIILSVAMFNSMSDIEEISKNSEAAMLLLKAALPAFYLLVDSLRPGKRKPKPDHSFDKT